MTITHDAEHPRATAQRISLSHRQLVRILLHLTAYVALLRSTAMGYGYPAYLEAGGQVDFVFLGVLNYVVAGLGILYVVIDAPFVLRALLSYPTVILFGGFLLITVADSEEPLISLRSLAVVLVITLPVLALVARFGSDQAFHVVRRFCTFAIYLNLVYAVAVPHYAFHGGFGGFLRGMFPHKNAFGAFMAIAFVIVLPSLRGMHLKQLRLEEVLCAGAAIIAAAFVALSRSASAWAMLGLFPVLYLGFRLILSIKNRYHRAVMWLVAVVSAIVSALVVYLFFFDLLLLGLGRDATLTNRTKIWTSLLDLVADHPLLGHGFGMFSRPEAFARYWGEFGWDASSTHSSYIELLLNVGYLTCIALGLIVLLAMWNSMIYVRKSDSLRLFRQQAIIVMILISGLTEAYRFLGGTFFWLAFVISLCFERSPTAPAARASQPSSHRQTVTSKHLVARPLRRLR